MAQCPRWLRAFFHIIGMLWILLGDSLQFLRLCLRFPTALAAENLFLRQQLVLWIGFCTVFPVLFFRHSRGLWLGFDFIFDPAMAEEPQHRKTP